MDIGIVIAAVIILIPVVVIWRMARATARTVYALESRIENLRKLETTVAKQNETIAGLKVEVAAQKTLGKLQGEAIETLRTEVAKWRAWFAELCQWVRTEAPDKDLNGFLAQLEAGQGG